MWKLNWRAALGRRLGGRPRNAALEPLEDRRLMSVTLWEDEARLVAGEQAVRNRPVGDQRGIRPTRIERWLVDGSF